MTVSRPIVPLFIAGPLVAAAYAAPVLTTTAVPTPAGTLSFNEFSPSLTDARPGLSGHASNAETITLGGTGSQSNSVGPYGNGIGLIDNGTWNSGKTVYFHLEEAAPYGSMTLSFDAGGVSELSFFLNYARYTNSPATVLTAYSGANATGTTLGTYDVSALAPVVTPGQTNAGAYRGLSDTSDSIKSIKLTGGVVVLDDLSFVRGTPEPATPALLAAAATVLLVRRRR